MGEVVTESLYQRLGGYDAIAAATDDLLARLQAIRNCVTTGKAPAPAISARPAS